MKKWYLSKTVWVNLIALIGIGLETMAGKEVLNAETQGVILTIINLVLRFVTSKGLTFGEVAKDVEDVIKPDSSVAAPVNTSPTVDATVNAAPSNQAANQTTQQ